MGKVKRPVKKRKSLKTNYKDYIRWLCNKFRSLVFAGEYFMDIQWGDDDDEDHKGRVCNAQIEIDETYLKIILTFYPNLKRIFDNGDYYRVAKTVLHEFCHILTEPLYLESLPSVSNDTSHYLEQIRERQTERITISIMQFLKKSDYEPPKNPHPRKNG